MRHGLRASARGAAEMSTVEPAAAGQTPEAISPLKEAWIVYRRNTPAVFGTLLLLVIVAFVLYGTFIYKGDPYEIIWAPQTPPGSETTVPLGTDNLGRDIMRGLLKGGGPTLAVGAAAATITLVVGILLLPLLPGQRFESGQSTGCRPSLSEGRMNGFHRRIGRWPLAREPARRSAYPDIFATPS